MRGRIADRKINTLQARSQIFSSYMSIPGSSVRLIYGGQDLKASVNVRGLTAQQVYVLQEFVKSIK